jgi:hypothetical protein
MRRKSYLWADQFGNKFYAATQRELKTQHGIPGKISPMYVDRADGRAVKVGVVIGQHWFTQYARVERPA